MSEKYDRSEFDKTRGMTSSIPAIPFADTIGKAVNGVAPFEDMGIATNLYNIPGVGVLLSELKSGADYPTHFHYPANEWVIVFEGALEFNLDGATVRLVAGQGLYIPAGAKHSCRAPVATKVIAITVPCDPAFPTGGDQNG